MDVSGARASFASSSTFEREIKCEMDMHTPSFIMTAFGDWLEEHFSWLFGGMITALLAVLGLVARISWQASGITTTVSQVVNDMKDQEVRTDRIESSLNSHKLDVEMHVNKLYMSALERRVDESMKALDERVTDFKQSVTAQHGTIQSTLDDIRKEVYRRK